MWVWKSRILGRLHWVLCSGSTRQKSRCWPGRVLIRRLWRRMCFQVHSGGWQNSVPCGLRTCGPIKQSVRAPCWPGVVLSFQLVLSGPDTWPLHQNTTAMVPWILSKHLEYLWLLLLSSGSENTLILEGPPDWPDPPRQPHYLQGSWLRTLIPLQNLLTAAPRFMFDWTPWTWGSGGIFRILPTTALQKVESGARKEVRDLIVFFHALLCLRLGTWPFHFPGHP